LLLLQDATHFASFCLTKELYEKIKEKQISTQYFSEMAQYSLKISKVRLQIRKVNSREVFTSYMGIEIRIIITEGEICESSLKSGMVDSRKNWWMKSLYRDDDVRSLILSKFHNRMTKWVD
jgi:dimeric dUTPase (all-alpha-NTP-PPase superfamily)